MAGQKCKNILLQAALKDFWSSANPKLKKVKFVETLTTLGSYWKNAKMGIYGSYFCLQSDLKYCPTMSFQKKAELWRSANLWKV